MKKETKTKDSSVSRREFLKIGGTAAAAAQIGAVAGATSCGACARPAMGRSRMQMSFPPLEAFEDPLLSYYRQFPAVYELDKLRMESIMPKKMQDTAKYGDFYTLIESWSSAWQASVPITESPEISDFRISGGGGRGRPIGDPVPFKSPALASELIKTVTHHFGASMVGITTINPDWCYNYGLRGSKERGKRERVGPCCCFSW